MGARPRANAWNSACHRRAPARSTFIRAGAMIEARHITKRYGDRVILDGADISVGSGQAVVLTGDNGSGKTTLLHVLVGTTACPLPTEISAPSSITRSPYLLVICLASIIAPARMKVERAGARR